MKKIRIDRRAAVLMALFLCLFALLAVLVKTGAVQAFDAAVSEFFYGLRAPWLTPAVKFITYSGNWQPVAAACALLLLLKPTRMKYGLPLTCGAVSQVVLYQVIKNILQRPRPDAIHFLVEEDGFGFPSGHTMIGVIFLGLLALILFREGKPRWLPLLAAVWGALIGLSRIYVGVHHPTDVLGGWCLGLAILLFWSQVFHLAFRPAPAAPSQR